MTEYRNENEVVIHSMGRSGSHAIMNWIASMYKEPIYCFNHCPLSDPFKSRIRYWARVKRRPIKKFFVAVPRHLKDLPDKREECRNRQKHCLMYSYEHKDIGKLKNGGFIEDRDYIIGKSKIRYNVLILRDFFNWLASRLLKEKYGGQPLNLFPQYNISGRSDWTQHASIIFGRNYRKAKKRKTLRFWKTYAREFLGRTNYLESTGPLKNKKICISFNQWFVDEEYRKQLANFFDLEYSDFSLGFAGSPSTFDEGKYWYGNAQEMKVFDRWKTLEDNIIYHEFLDPEAMELSYEIFGREIGGSLEKINGGQSAEKQ